MSFDWSALIPLEVAATITILPGILNAFGRKRAATLAAGGQYGISVGIRIFIWFFAFVSIALPFIVQMGPLKCKRAGCAFHFDSEMIAIYCALVFFSFMGAMWMDRYVVNLFQDSFEVGAFRKTKMRYKDVTSLNVVISSRGTPFLHIYCGKKLKLKIDGNLQNFDDLVEKLKARVDSAKKASGNIF